MWVNMLRKILGSQRLAVLIIAMLLRFSSSRPKAEWDSAACTKNCCCGGIKTQYIFDKQPWNYCIFNSLGHSKRKVSLHTPSKSASSSPPPPPSYAKTVTGTPQSPLSSSLVAPPLKIRLIPEWRPSPVQEPRTAWASPWTAGQLQNVQLLSSLPHLSSSHPSRLASYPTSSPKTSPFSASCTYNC